MTTRNKLFVISAIVVMFSAVVFALTDGQREFDGSPARHNVTSDQTAPNNNEYHSLLNNDADMRARLDRMVSDQREMKQDISMIQSNTAKVLNEIKQQLESIQRKDAEQPQETRSPVTDIDTTPTVSSGSGAEPTEDELKYQFQNLADQVFTQDIDPHWSEGAAKEIISTAGNEIFKGSNIVQTECRSSLCFVNVAHSDSESMDKFINKFPSKLGWNNSAGQIRVEDEEGHLTTKFIIARPGYKIPESSSALQ